PGRRGCETYFVGRSPMAAANSPTPPQYHHDKPECQKHKPPIEIDVDTQRPFINGPVTHRAKNGQQNSYRGEYKSDRQADVESHKSSNQAKTRFSRTNTTRMATANVAGLVYQARCWSLGFSVSEYTSPTSSLSGRGW